MELDRLLPSYHFRSRFQRRVAADPDTTWRAYQELTTEELPFLRALMRVRGLGRVRLRGPVSRAFPVPRLTIGPYEEVRGRAAKYWRLRAPAARISHRDPEAFRELREPGWAKAAMGVQVVPDGDGSVLSAETRVLCTDGRSRAAFTAYWVLIAGGAALIRWELLRATARRAERQARA
ncbi:hypothetical protein ACQUSR_24615 [Streptomyces sp. P1-3]|uniref:hypothetical protein n=1 Tax=Streptomyces sp. P1-3 TaxID=3421658 RepID=UPI003D369F75